MKVYGGKKYDIITADSAYLVGKTFETVDKKKFIVGEDIDKYAVLKINMPSGGVITTRNEDYTMHEESYSSGEIYMVVCEGLDSIELPSGASAEIGKLVSQTSGNGSTNSGSASGGGASTWEDLGYKKEIATLIDETVKFPTSTNPQLTTPFTVVDGETYTVTIGDATYQSVGRIGTKLLEGISSTVHVIGNASFADAEMFEDTGETFAITCIYADDVPLMTIIKSEVHKNTTVSVTVIGTKGEVNKIPTQFLPDTPKICANMAEMDSDVMYAYKEYMCMTKLTVDELTALVIRGAKVCLYDNGALYGMYTPVFYEISDGVGGLMAYTADSDFTLMSAEYTEG